MRKFNLVNAGAMALIILVAACAKEVGFRRDVFPIFQERCITCHAVGSPGCIASGFSVASYESLMKGTRYGPMIIPGNSLDSNLLRLVKHQADPSIAMPRSPVPGAPSEWISPEQISMIEKWIDQGAKNN
jgi:hypothetical protein